MSVVPDTIYIASKERIAEGASIGRKFRQSLRMTMPCGKTLHKLSTDIETSIHTYVDETLYPHLVVEGQVCCISALLDNRANCGRITVKKLPSSAFSSMAEAMARAKKKPVVCVLYVYCPSTKRHAYHAAAAHQRVIPRYTPRRLDPSQAHCTKPA